MKLSHLLMVSLFIAGLLVSIIGGYYNYNNMNELLKEQVFYQMETTVQSRAHHIEYFLEEQKDKIKIAATHLELPNEELIDIMGVDDEFYELMVLDKDGKVKATTNPEEAVGTDLSQELFFLNGKEEVYVQDAYYDEEFRRKAIAISAPYNNGVLVIKIGLEELNKITTDRTGLGETGEVYVVNKEKKLLTPSRFMINNIMVQDVKTKNVENCLIEMGTTEHIGHQAVTPFLDYRGETVFGTHYTIPDMQWCILAEIDEAEVFGTPRIRFIKSASIISIIIILFMTLIGFFVGKKLEKKMKLSTALVIILLPVLLLISVGAAYFYHQTVSDILTEQISYHLETTAQSRANHVEYFLEEQKHKIEIAATHLELLDEELIAIKDSNREFYELFTLDKDGKVKATTNPEEEVGEDFSKELFFLNGKKEVYVQDAYYDEEFRRKAIAISAPHAGGVLVIKIGLEELNKITTDRTGLGETGEVYVVNKEGYMISSFRFKEDVILEQKVDTENSRECLEDLEEYYVEDEKEVEEHEEAHLIFTNYREIEVLGTHAYVHEMQWCLLVEIDEAEISERTKEHYFNQLLVTLIVITLSVILMGFFIGNYFEKKNKGRKIKKFPCGVRGKFQPWYCKLIGGKCETYPNGRCGMVIKIRKFLTNLKLSHLILIALIFVIGYFFIVTSFFQGWQNAKFFDDIPDLIFLLIALIVLCYSLRLRNDKVRGYIISGSILIALAKLIEVPLQEYQAIVGKLGLIYWLPPFLLLFFGFLLILFAFKEGVK